VSEEKVEYRLVPTGMGWYALYERTDQGERQIDVLPEPAAMARYEELTGEQWAEDRSDEATADKPS